MHVWECVDVWAYMYACVYPPPFTSLLETFWRQEAGYPYAALQGFPPKLALQRGPGMGLEIQPGHECQTCALAGVCGPEEGESLSLMHPEGAPSVNC